MGPSDVSVWRILMTFIEMLRFKIIFFYYGVSYQYFWEKKLVTERDAQKWYNRNFVIVPRVYLRKEMENLKKFHALAVAWNEGLFVWKHLSFSLKQRKQFFWIFEKTKLGTLKPQLKFMWCAKHPLNLKGEINTRIFFPCLPDYVPSVVSLYVLSSLWQNTAKKTQTDRVWESQIKMLALLEAEYILYTEKNIHIIQLVKQCFVCMSIM